MQKVGGKLQHMHRVLLVTAGVAVLVWGTVSCGISDSPAVRYPATTSAEASLTGPDEAEAGGGTMVEGLREASFTDTATGSAADSRSTEGASRTTQLERTVEQTLVSLASASAQPTRDEMLNALLSAGFDADAIEVSISETPTGLEVDAIAAAVLAEDQCIIGQVRDGGVTVTVLPVLGTGFCFIGDQR